MSKVQTLRVFVNQRLSLAAEEIFDLFERTIAEYEEQLCRQNKLLDAVYKPEVRLHRADIQLLLLSKVPSEEQEQSSSLDEEDPPELPRIKEELEELCTNQEEELLQIDAINEKPQFSQLHQSRAEENGDAECLKTEVDQENHGGPEPICNSNPDGHSEPHISNEVSHSGKTSSNSAICAASSDDKLYVQNQNSINQFSHLDCSEMFSKKKSFDVH